MVSYCEAAGHVAMSQAAMGGATLEAQQICRRGGYFLCSFCRESQVLDDLGLIRVNGFQSC